MGNNWDAWWYFVLLYWLLAFAGAESRICTRTAFTWLWLPQQFLSDAEILGTESITSLISKVPLKWLFAERIVWPFIWLFVVIYSLSVLAWATAGGVDGGLGMRSESIASCFPKMESTISPPLTAKIESKVSLNFVIVSYCLLQGQLLLRFGCTYTVRNLITSLQPNASISCNWSFFVLEFVIASHAPAFLASRIPLQ